MKTEHIIEADYIVRKTLIVTLLDEDDDPTAPDNWDEIIDEYDTDCQLQDVVSYEGVNE